jgi:hypothetical protein
MTQISRPLQIALGAVVLLAAVWFIALRGHSSSSESSAPAPAATSASASSAATSGPAASQSASGETGGSSQATKTYHGSAPGVGGLTRAIEKARGAATASEQNAKALQQKATQASGGSSATQTQQVNSSAVSTGGKAAPQSVAKTHSASASAKAPAAKSTPTKTANGVPVMQARVEGELKHGDVVALLFWNPHGTVDATVRRELQAASHKLHGKLAIHVARANQVGSFGSFTRTVQVYSTPTILLVNTHAKTASLAGLTDVFSIEQAVREVKSAK